MATAKKAAPAKKVAVTKKIAVAKKTAPAKKAAPKKSEGLTGAADLTEIEKILLVQGGFKPLRIMKNEAYPLHNSLHPSYANIAGTSFANFGLSGECVAFVYNGELRAILPLQLFKSQMNDNTNVLGNIGECDNENCEVSAGQVLFYKPLFLDNK